MNISIARSITKWTKACDKLLNRLISNIHHTCEYKQYCYVGNTAKKCRLGLFQDSNYAGDFEDSKSTTGGILCIFGSNTFGCARNRLRSHTVQRKLKYFLFVKVYAWMETKLSIFRNLVVEVFHSSPNQLNKTKNQVRGNSSRNTTSNKHTQNQIKVPTQHDNFYLSDVDYVPSNAKFSQFGAMLYIFEENEAVIKMIIKDRCSTMRHVSSTRRVALDWSV